MRTTSAVFHPALLTLLATLAIGIAEANTPTIRLFPTTVVEDLRQTGNVARDMETGLQEVIGRLDQQQELYNESKCDGAEDDAGCQRLARQIGASYLDMLTIMEERLPDMEHTVNNTRQSLEKSLRNELGKKMTPWIAGNADRRQSRQCRDKSVAHPARPIWNAAERTLQTILSTGRYVRRQR